MSAQDNGKFEQWYGLEYRAAAMQVELNWRNRRGISSPWLFAGWSVSRIERNLARILRALQSVGRPEWED